MRKAALFLAGLLLLAAAVVLTAAPKVVVKTMAYGDNSNPEGVNWLRIVAAFEKANPDIDIDFELLYDEAYHQKVVARLAAGDAAAPGLHGGGRPLGHALEGGGPAVRPQALHGSQVL